MSIDQVALASLDVLVDDARHPTAVPTPGHSPRLDPRDPGVLAERGIEQRHVAEIVGLDHRLGEKVVLDHRLERDTRPVVAREKDGNMSPKNVPAWTMLPGRTLITSATRSCRGGATRRLRSAFFATGLCAA